MKTIMKTWIVLGLFSLAPMMNNVYASPYSMCLDKCTNSVNTCINDKCGKYKNNPTDYKPCLGACQTSHSACLGTCKGMAK